MAKFKEGKSTKDRLNNQLIINISSLCKFIKKTVEKKVEEEKKREKRKLMKMELETERKKIHKLMLDPEKNSPELSYEDDHHDTSSTSGGDLEKPEKINTKN